MESERENLSVENNFRDSFSLFFSNSMSEAQIVFRSLFSETTAPMELSGALYGVA